MSPFEALESRCRYEGKLLCRNSMGTLMPAWSSGCIRIDNAIYHSCQSGFEQKAKQRAHPASVVIAEPSLPSRRFLLRYQEGDGGAGFSEGFQVEGQQWQLGHACLVFYMFVPVLSSRVATVRFGSVRFLKPFENLSPVSGGYS